MTIVSKKTFSPGDIPTAAQLNAPYDDLASASANIKGNNSATGWITHRHLETDDTGQAVFNTCKQYNQPTGTSDYNNTAYQTITYLGSPAQITLNYTPDIGEVVRFAASGMTGEHDVAIDYDYAAIAPFIGPNKGKPNFYAFRLLLNHTTGGVGGTIVLGEWGYSFTTKTNGTLTFALAGGQVTAQINWQPFAFSTLYRQDQLRTLNSVELQCKVFDATNTLQIERHQLYAIRGKR
jgi:hypothetical protein